MKPTELHDRQVSQPFRNRSENGQTRNRQSISKTSGVRRVEGCQDERRECRSSGFMLSCPKRNGDGDGKKPAVPIYKHAGRRTVFEPQATQTSAFQSDETRQPSRKSPWRRTPWKINAPFNTEELPKSENQPKYLPKKLFPVL